MRISGHKLLTLKAEILELGEWIAPVVKHNLATLIGGLEDVEGLWFDPNTGVCYKNDRTSVVSLLSFQKVFTRRVREIENLVKATNASRNESIPPFFIPQRSN